MESLQPSAPHPLPFATDLDIRAFVLPREAGNLMVYAAPTAAPDVEIARHYLNHWHEAAFIGDDGPVAPLHVHEADRGPVEERDIVVAGTFSERVVLDGDFELIPTPGHTPGATAFLWDSGERRYLFTGDSIYLHEGEWIAAVLDSSDRAAYLDTLALLREVEFDVLVPWAATSGEPYFASTTPSETRRRIDAIIARLRAGGSH
jgi:glyoxylase-like metal-dependent hydrolase (beta-lactamase superfamily II)